MITLSPQLPEFSRLWAEEDGIEAPVIPDLGLGVARTYGLVFRLPDDLIRVYRDKLKIDLPRFNGDASWALPMPATFVLDTAGSIRYRAVHPDHTTRPEPDEVLSALRRL